MPALKLFLFDLDGTLVSTGGAGVRALNRAFRELYGISDPLPTINPSGKTDPAIFREVIRHFLGRDMRDEEKKTIAQAYLRHLLLEIKSAQALKILAGVREFLDQLKTRTDVVMGLGTGNLEEGARLKLSPTDLNPYFSFGGFGSDAEERAEVLRHGHRRAELHAGEAIPKASVYVVGDTVLDIEAARGAGFRSAGVASGGVPYETLAAAGPDFVMKSMTEAPKKMSGL